MNQDNSLYYQAITYDNLYNCYKDIRKTCKNKNKKLKFEINLCTNIYNIYLSLLNETYKPLKYNIFAIHEKKTRIVMSQEISDKIVNRFVVKYYLIPLLEKKLIDTNVASRLNKGASYADKKLYEYLNILNMKYNSIYALKIDISKYFYNIDKTILLNMLKKDIKDKHIINILNIIMNETNKDYINTKINIINEKSNSKLPLYLNNKGLSLGAVSSQFLAIYYLNGLHHYIKEKLSCKFFLAYMDDFIILDNDKSRLVKVWKDINSKINGLNLEINNKSNIYNLKYGFRFIGLKYRIVYNKIFISTDNRTRHKIFKRLKIIIG